MTILDGKTAVENGARSASLHSRAHAPVALDSEQLGAHYTWLRAVTRNLVRDPWGAEDVAQETLLAALAAPPHDCADAQRLRAWLGRVAFNLSRLGARKAARQHAREVRVARREALPGVSEELELAGTARSLAVAVGLLPEPYRGAIVMRYYDGLSTAEIAERMGVSDLAVRKRLWRARNKLRQSLDRGQQRGQLWAALLPWNWLGNWLGRGLRAKGLAGMAAALALGLGAVTWWGSFPRMDESPARTLLARAPEGADRGPDVPVHGVPAQDEALDQGGTPQARTPAKRPWIPDGEPEQPPLPEAEEAPAILLSGIVLDLEGNARPGLEIVAANAPARMPAETTAEPEEILAISDVLGGFRLSVPELPFSAEARGPGWTTIVRAGFVPGCEPDTQALLVAPARDLAAQVLDESGRPVCAAHIELRCDERAFARVPLPVRLPSGVLRVAESDAAGRCSLRALPRAAGLSLRLSAAGFEELELDSLALGDEERFFLRALPEEAVLAGSVFHRDGRPAAGAQVRLALASTRTDARGRYRLPLRGVQSDSSLEAADQDDLAEPVELSDFGARLRRDSTAARPREVDLVLGDERDRVGGKLSGAATEGWIVAAFARGDARRERNGHEGRTVPADLTRSAADGAFAFVLPRGAYDVYALAPDGVRVVTSATLATREGPWTLELPPAQGLVPWSSHVRGEDGRLLAGAEIEVRVRLDDGGHRTLTWKRMLSDEQGAFGFARDPAWGLELLVTHGAFARETHTVSPGQPAADLCLSRPAFLQVREAGEHAETCALLDEEGRVLAARGPLRHAQRFGLRSGASPVLEVPPSARWLELQQAGREPVLVPIAPRAGEIQHVRP